MALDIDILDWHQAEVGEHYAALPGLAVRIVNDVNWKVTKPDGTCEIGTADTLAAAKLAAVEVVATYAVRQVDAKKIHVYR